MSIRHLSPALPLVLVITAACGASSPGDVTATAKDTFTSSAGATQVDVDATTWTSVSALAGGTTYPGTLGGGAVSIADVPDGSYFLHLVSPARTNFPSVPPSITFFELSERALDLGGHFTTRSGLVPLTKASTIALSAPLTVPWQASVDAMGMPTTSPDDVLYLFSRNTFGVGSVIGGSAMTGPVNGDTALKGWQIDGSQALSAYGAASAFDATKGDTLDALHGKTTVITDATAPANSPWAAYTTTSVVEALQSAPFSLANGGSASVTGTFVPTPAKPYAIDYPGTAWNPLLGDAPTSTLASAYVDLTVYLEPGTPNPGLGADATLLDVTTYASQVFANPTCAPGCAASACPSGCNSTFTLTLPGDLKHAFTYGNPFSYGQERATLTFGFSADVSALLPANKSSTFLQGFFSVDGPIADTNGVSIAPTLGLPRKLTLGGKALPIGAVTTGVGATPTLAFEAPSMGTPEAYIAAVSLVDEVTGADGTVQSQLRVAFFRFTGTTLALPAGLLEPGKHYCVFLTAVVDSISGTAPRQLGLRSVEARTFTGVFSI